MMCDIVGDVSELVFGESGGAEVEAPPPLSLDRDASFDMLADLDHHHYQHHHHHHPASLEGCLEDEIECGGAGAGGAAALAARLAGAVCGLQRTLSLLLGAAHAHTHAHRDPDSLRAELAALRDHNDALRARLLHENHSIEEISFPKDMMERSSVQEQPTNGG